ncbi:flagellar hook-length control protein FliK [Roseomonas sp. HF4]|uniref:flagellar hook-length control protein FliK n=1 Tax=Roseomonas sp. HF4 TaxID=2562313 RepID=UPI0014854C0A|nr:flagellar hook-length control protein FliK [Roseomonas sp. HF4]
MDAIAATPPVPAATALPEAPALAPGQAFAAVLARAATPGPLAGAAAAPGLATPGLAMPEPAATALPPRTPPIEPSVTDAGDIPAVPLAMPQALPSATTGVADPVDAASPGPKAAPTADWADEDPPARPDAGPGHVKPDPPPLPQPADVTAPLPPQGVRGPGGTESSQTSDPAGATGPDQPAQLARIDAGVVAPPGAPRPAAMPLSAGEPVERQRGIGARHGPAAAARARTAAPPGAGPPPEPGPGPTLAWPAAPAARPTPVGDPPVAAVPNLIAAPPPAERRAVAAPGSDSATGTPAAAAPGATRPDTGDAAAMAAAAPRGLPPAAPARQITPVVVAIAVAGGTARLSVTLEPAELGRVEISVEGSGAAAQVRILAERPETLALLQRDQAEIERSLTQSGLVAEGRSLALGLAGQGPGSGFGRDRRREGTASDGRASRGAAAGPPGIAEAPPPRRALSLLDLAI